MPTTAKPSAGPWFVSPKNPSMVRNSDGIVAVAQVPDLNGDEAEGEANARLIASVHDLLRACRDARSMVMAGIDKNAVANCLAAAIDKAEGRSP